MKQVIGVVLLCFGVACNLTVLADSTDEVAPSERIINGVSVTAPIYPYMLSFRVNGEHFCAAVVVSPSAALTSGFCAEQIYFTKDLSKLTLAGGSQFRGGTVTFPVIKISIHPKFVRDQWPLTSEYNIAVLTVPTNAFKGPRNVGPILIRNTPTEVNARCFVLGWGRGYTWDHQAYLQYLNVNVITQSSCATQWNQYGPVSQKVTPATICAQAVDAGAGQGDEGGPLVCGNRLVGIVSFVDLRWMAKRLPIGFTRISEPSVRLFIKQAAFI